MLDLKDKPWEKAEIPPNIYYPRGMIGPEERRCFYWLARHALSGAGCIVDAGSFIGASTFCFAAGAAENTCFMKEKDGKLPRPVVHAFDVVQVLESYVGEAIRKDFRPIAKGDSYLDIFEYQTALFASFIRLQEGDFLEKTWTGEPIEILFVDLAKTRQLNSHIVKEFFPSLIPGRSLLLHQDYFHCWHPYIHITMEYLRDEFDLLDEHIPFQTRLWRLSRDIPEGKLQRVCDYSFVKDERLALLDRLVEVSSPHSRPMMEVVRLWQRCLDKDYGDAKNDLSRLRAVYDLDGRPELWFRQALQIERIVDERTAG